MTARSKRSRLRILLVDDSDGVRLTLGALLEDEGHDVTSLASAGAARAAIEDSATAAAGFDVVLLDQHLPDGLGLDLVPRLRQTMPRATIALLSGSAPAEAGVNVDAVLLKGLSATATLEWVAGIAARAAAGAAAADAADADGRNA